MKSINQQAPVRCSKTIEISAGSATVWQVLTDINQWAVWQNEISQPVLTGPLQPGATFTWKTGGARIVSTLHTVEPNKCFGWTGKTFGMFAIHNWTMADNGGKTIVSVEESMEGLLASLFKKTFNKNLAKGMQQWLDLLKVACENAA